MEGFFTPERLKPALDLYDRLWRECPDSVVVDDLDSGERQRMSAVQGRRRTHRYKLNDLYLDHDAIRDLRLDERLTQILWELMIDQPVCCNTLSFEYGSQQPLHVDALYMKPPSPHNLTASWIALEDTRPESGPMRYVPGSHVIPQYRFSNGDTRSVAEEMAAWHAYMDQKVTEYGLEVKTFLPPKGDLFIWSSYLYHGGSHIADKSATGMSLVTHYFTKTDAERMCPLVEHNAGYWMKKPKLQVEAPRTSQTRRAGATREALPLVEDLLRTTVHHGRRWLADIRRKF